MRDMTSATQKCLCISKERSSIDQQSGATEKRGQDLLSKGSDAFNDSKIGDKTRQDKTTLFSQGGPISCKAGILRGPGFYGTYIYTGGGGLGIGRNSKHF